MITASVRAGCIAAALAAVAWITWPLMPLAGHGFGGDWGYFLSYLLAGEQWVRLNGWLSPAYFTPAFCGGIPFLANPQSMQWSVPQLLFVLLGPAAMPWALLMLSAAAGGAGTWLLARRSFGVSAEAASLACVLFVLNGFLTFRVQGGQATYWAFAALPWIAWLVLGGRRFVPGRVVIAALLLAAMVFGGALNFVVPAVLGVAALILLRQVGTGLDFAPWRRLAGACLWSLPVAAIKLAPAAVFTLQYPRRYLSKALFGDPFVLADALVSGFFWPANLPPTQGMGAGRAYFDISEFEFGVSVVPAVVILVWAIYMLRAGRRLPHLGAAVLLAALFAVPLAGSAGPLQWGSVLEHIPVVNNNTLLVRWWVIYMLPLIVLCAVGVEGLVPAPAWRPLVLAGCSAVAIAQFATRDLATYRSLNRAPLIDPASLITWHERLAAGGTLPPIAELGRWPPGTETMSSEMAPMSLMGGVSSLPCYEPLFGYALELFPARALRAGPVEDAGGSFANLADPRCYLDPGSESCHPGERFRSGDPAIAAFVSYRPIPWRAPLWQRAAAWSTVLSLIASAGVLGFAVFARRRPA